MDWRTPTPQAPPPFSETILPKIDTWSAIDFGNNAWVTIAGASINVNVINPSEISNSVAVLYSGARAWQLFTLPAVAGWTGVAYGAGVWVAVAYSGQIARSTTNGATWTLTAAPSASWCSIAFANGIFMAVADDGSILTSTNGYTSWTSRSTGSPYLRHVAFGGGTWVVCGRAYFSGGVWRSTDNGATWTAITMSGAELTTNDPFYGGVAYGDGVFTIGILRNTFGQTNTTIVSADLGVTWTATPLPSPVDDWICAASTSKIVLVGILRTAVSTDSGANWGASLNPPPNPTASVNGLAFGDGRFARVGNGTNVVVFFE
jgi:hypothetical protein